MVNYLRQMALACRWSKQSYTVCVGESKIIFFSEINQNTAQLLTLVTRYITLKYRVHTSNVQNQNDRSKITRKSKTEAVLQRRSMLKLGVICIFMKRYGYALCHEMFTWSSKCYAWGEYSFCLFQVYWACTQFRLLFAVCLVVYLNKQYIDNDVFVS